MPTARLVEPPPIGRSAAWVAVVSAALFAILTALVMANHTAALDRELILSLRADASPLLTTILLAVTFTSGKLAIPAALLFAIVLYRRSGARTSLYYAGACITGELLDALLKYDVHRVRPHGISPRLTAAGGFSYPSADVMLAVLIFGLGIWMLTWTMRSPWMRAAAIVAATVFVVLAAVARVYLGAHWPTDVLGGALAGIACAAFWIGALRRTPASPVTVAGQER
jgi:membrane-associated phospholipid phosphatase